MATVTITALSKKDQAAQTFQGQLGEANGAAHKPMYLKASDNKWYLANANTTTEEAGENGIAISLQKGQTDEWIEFASVGNFVAQGTFANGATYILGGTADGDINEDADAATPNWYKTVLFVAGASSGTNTELKVSPIVSGVTE